MSKEKIFVVGDVHGCLEMLKRLIDKIEWNPSIDRLIFIGDYIDRGENSKGVIDYILKLKEDSTSIQCLIGNHEQMFLDYLSGVDSKSFLLNGGLSTLRSYGEKSRSQNKPPIPPSHLDFFSSLLSMVELEHYYIVHAGFRPNIAIEDQNLNDMIWIREEFIYSDYDFGKLSYLDIPHLTALWYIKNKIGIDTGAVFGNYLTCLELPEEKFHSVRPR